MSTRSGDIAPGVPAYLQNRAGISLDRHAHEETTGKEVRISSALARVDVMVIPVDESAIMAEEAMNLS